MTLADLAFASFVFAKIDNGKYGEFREKTNGLPDLTNPEHRKELLVFLNGWGCRIDTDYFPRASDEIIDWYRTHYAALPDTPRNLWDLTDEELTSVGTAFDNLANRTIATRNQKGKNATFDQTRAAKMLFAIRPKSLIAWDNAIRNAYVRPNGSYTDFLRITKRQIGELASQCEHRGFNLQELPMRLNKADETIPKLIDEYNWITITNGLNPTVDDFRRWAEWIKT